MFKALMLCAIFGMALASPLGIPQRIRPKQVARISPQSKTGDVDAVVISRQEDVRADGFDASLETSNQIVRQDSGDAYGNIHGSYSWISPEGEHIQVTYVADENGYQPQGAVLPTPPPVPIEIQRALAWIAAHEQQPEQPLKRKLLG